MNKLHYSLHKRFTLQKKVWFFMVILLLSTSGLTLALFEFVLTPEFLHLERLEVQKNVERLDNAIKGEMRRLNMLSRDYATWDDMYDFVQTQRPEFSKSNLTPDLTQTLELNLIYIVDRDRNIVWKQTVDQQSDEALHIENLPDISFPHGHPLLALDDKKNPTALLNGIWGTDIGPLIVASRPIRNSSDEGIARGWLIMGRMLDDVKINAISEQTKLSVSLHTDALESNAFRSTTHTLSSNSWYETFSQELVVAYISFPCILGNSKVTLKIEIGRDIFLRGEKTRKFMMLMVFCSFLFVFILFSLLLKKFIISPITTLTSHILELEVSKNIQLRLPQEPEGSRDEACILTNQVNRLLDTIEVMHRKLEEDARLDPLTGLANRRYYMEYRDREWNYLVRSQGMLALIVCDIDYFKLYNDTYGHQQGDKCLVMVSDLIRSVLQRPRDLVCRYGGEEFVILLPDTGLEEGIHIAGKIKEEFSSWKIPHKSSPVEENITASMGVAAVAPRDEGTSDLLFEMADNALYQAKEQGRNQVCSHKVAHVE